MRKLTAILLMLAMLVTLVPAYAADEQAAEAETEAEAEAPNPWDQYQVNELSMPFKPADKYLSHQNPPDFTWPYVEGATYDVIVCRDEGLTDVAYQKTGITTNYYNFEYTFETGVYYWWAVRFNMGGSPSGWSRPLRFKIDPDAYPFPVEPIDKILEKVPEQHPRIWTTPDTIDEFRSYAQSGLGKEVYDTVYNSIKADVDAGNIAEEPEYQTFEDPVVQQQFNMQLVSMASELYTKMLKAAFIYLINPQETAFGEYAVDSLIALSGWDQNGATSYEKQDQVHRAITYNAAMAYDWVYDLMTPQERQIALDMISSRTKTMAYLLDSLKVSPYDSHGWTAFGYIGIISLATYGDIPESAGWLETVIPAFTTLLPPWSTEDGGWSQGTDYWQYSTGSNREFVDVLCLGGLIDLNKKAWSQNEYLWPMYAYPAGSTGAFGDAGNLNKPMSYTVNSMNKLAFFTNNPVAKWVADEVGQLSPSDLATYYIAPVAEMEAEKPYTYHLGHEFDDIGWATMHSDLIDQNRVSLFFRSSQYGAYNHAHPDQNSFIINAYGENLAIKSGYYDAYHSSHDSGFTRKTYAHNTITIDGGKGQRDDAMSTKGEITAFATHADFDVVAGDATPAYNGLIGGFDRKIIYLRPDMFVVIDDLKAAEGDDASFEWWLNASHAMEVYDDNTGARITENDAVLDVKVQYPKVTPYYTSVFSGPDLEHVPASGNYASAPVHTRVWFKTEKVEQTKMVVTMDVHKKDAEARYTQVQESDDCMRLTFEDGSVVLVNMGDGTQPVTSGGVTFTGDAVVYNDDSVMLVEGTALSMDGKEIFRSETPVTVVAGKDELSVSANDDASVWVGVGNDYIPAVNSITDWDGRSLSSAIGIASQEEEGGLRFTFDKGHYSMVLNDKELGGQTAEGKLTVTIDGTSTEYPLSGFVDRNGNGTYSGTVSMDNKSFMVKSKNPELTFGAATVGNDMVGTASTTASSTVADNYIELETMPVVSVNSEVVEDYDALKETMPFVVEAEEYDALTGGGLVYSHREFLSGGKGLQNVNTPGDRATYTFQVTEAGTYDFAVKYVAWDEAGDADGVDVETYRNFIVNGTLYQFLMPKTDGYGATPEEWRALKVDAGIYLEPGEYTVSIQAVTGSCNTDWLGLVKREG